MLKPIARIIGILLAMQTHAMTFASEIHPSHEAVRAAVERGEILPLEAVLVRVRETLPGQITRTEIEIKKGRWFYEFRVIDPSGRITKVYVDARTAEIVQSKRK